MSVKVMTLIILTLLSSKQNAIKSRHVSVKTYLDNSSYQGQVNLSIYLEGRYDFEIIEQKVIQFLRLPKINQTTKMRVYQKLKSKISKNWRRFDCLNNGHLDKRSKKCVCPKQYKGKWCEEKSETTQEMTTQAGLNCDQEPCLNDGECIENDQKSRCECPLGFQGELCEKSKWI